MAGPLNSVLRHIRRLVAPPDHSSLTDRQLLARFSKDGDQTAFESLVQRHGAMVLSVCRRVLSNADDAEDAFQSTFLVLSRKAAALYWHDSVANWLYGVAYRIAMKARVKSAKRQTREKTTLVETGYNDDPLADMTWREAQQVLDEELHRLPDKYRAALVLCYLEGKTRDEAAEQLGWTIGTVKGRLERGRDLLRARLTKRCVGLSSALLGAFLLHNSASALPPALVAKTALAGVAFATGKSVADVASAEAVALANGVLQSMVTTKAALAATLLTVVGVLALGGGYFAHAAWRGTPAPTKNADPVAVVREKEPDQSEVEKPPVAEPKFDPFAGAAKATGFIKAISPQTRQLTVAVPIPREERTVEKEFILAPEVRVEIDGGKAGHVSDLLNGNSVAVYCADDGQTVIGIKAEGQQLRRMAVRAVDVEASRISLSRGQYVVAADAAISLDGKPATLADLRPEMLLAVKLSVDKRTVVAIRNDVEREKDKN